jgi:hypothetical protein
MPSFKTIIGALALFGAAASAMPYSESSSAPAAPAPTNAHSAGAVHCKAPYKPASCTGLLCQLSAGAYHTQASKHRNTDLFQRIFFLQTAMQTHAASKTKYVNINFCLDRNLTPAVSGQQLERQHHQLRRCFGISASFLDECCWVGADFTTVGGVWMTPVTTGLHFSSLI